MKTSTLLTMALVAISQTLGASAAANPSKVQNIPNQVRQQKGVQKPSAFPVPGGLTSQGCFSNGANFTLQTTPAYFSSGSCEKVCTGKNFPVMALHGDQCLCGNVYPPKSDMVKDSNCNYPCPGYPEEACGSLGDPGFWSVFNTGINVNVPNMSDDDNDSKTKTSSSASSSTAASTSAPTAPAATQTQDNSDGNKGGGSSGPNTAGIAAGVVVGVVVVAAIIGGFFWWMRRRRNAEIEEDHRRNAAVNAFINGSKPPSSHGSISMTDSRLDPVMAHRRMSDGSIADNQDYSRRILRVTNA